MNEIAKTLSASLNFQRAVFNGGHVSGIMGSTPQPRTIKPPVQSKLPNEVMMEILSYLDLKSLLRCRLVCERWNTLATLICQEGHLCISNALRRGQSQETVFNINIVDFEFSPFTSCVYFLKPESSAFSNWFPYLGNHLRELTTIGHYDDPKTITDLLLETPNLEKLRLSLPPNESEPGNKGRTPFDKFVLQLLSTNEWYLEDDTSKMEWNKRGLVSKLVKTFKFYFATLEVGGMSLRNLTTLQISITGWKSIQLLDLLTTKSEAQLKSIYLKYYSSASAGEYVETVARLVSTIPKIVLEIRYWKMSKSIISTFAGIKLTGLVVSMLYATSFEPYYYQPLEAFLAKVGHHLQFFTLRPYKARNNLDPPRVRLSIPPLRNLKCITFSQQKDFRVEFTASFPPAPFGFQFLIPFNTNHFPALKKVVLNGPKNLNAFFGSSAHFDSVEELVLKDDIYAPILADAKWERVFPNLKSIDTAVDPQNLMYIFCHMKMLERLCLTLGPPAFDEGETFINDVFAGIHNSCAAAKLLPDQIERLIAESVAPSLRSLSRLKTMKLYFTEFNDYEEFENCGVMLSICWMTRLDYLYLSNAKTSAEWLSRMRERHNRVEISS